MVVAQIVVAMLPEREGLHAVFGFQKGVQVYTPAQIHALLKVAGRSIKAMILLGINCGYGNMDCVKLPINKFDLEGGWANFPCSRRSPRKSGHSRRTGGDPVSRI